MISIELVKPVQAAQNIIENVRNSGVAMDCKSEQKVEMKRSKGKMKINPLFPLEMK